MQEDSPKIIFVDDEPQVLDGLRRALRGQRKNWNMTFCEGGKEALEKIQSAGCDVLVTDMRMPGMSGLELLKEVRTHSPKTARIVLSGYTEQKVVIESVDLVHQALLKPMEASKVQLAIQNCLEAVKCLSSKVKAGIVYLNGMPGLTLTKNQFTEALNTQPTKSELAAIAASDPFIGSRLLRVANSPFFGKALIKIDLEEAINVVGPEALSQLVAAGKFEQSEHFPNGIPQPYIDVLTDSAKMGRLCLEIFSILKGNSLSQPEALTAGLLSFLGRLAFFAIDEEFSTSAMNLDKPIYDSEINHFGIDFAKAGATLANLWGMPAYFSTVIENQLQPSQSKYPSHLLLSLHLAQIVYHETKNNLHLFPLPQLDKYFITEHNFWDDTVTILTRYNIPFSKQTNST